MERKDIKPGDLVMIADGSQATRLDKYEKNSGIGCCRHDFEVLSVNNIAYKVEAGWFFHDIHIRDTRSGRIYLHSSTLVKPGTPKVKEMTLPEIIKELGYEVKIVK